MKLEPKHYKAIFLLVSGKNTRATAKEIGVAESTVTKWKNDRDFNEALQQAFSRIYDEAINKLASIALVAAEELEKIVVCADVPLKHKLQAISLVLTHGEKAKNYQLENRLQRLEELALNEVGDEEIITSEIE